MIHKGAKAKMAGLTCTRLALLENRDSARQLLCQLEERMQVKQSWRLGKWQAQWLGWLGNKPSMDAHV